MKKRLISLVLVLCMCMSLLPAVSAETVNSWDSNIEKSWYDSTKDEFIITTAGQLAGLASLVNTGTAFEKKTITLGGDMDLAGKEWTPIGLDKYFKGTFDGADHSISNLNISKQTSGYAGLFGRVSGATITNVMLTDTAITASGSGAAGIVGYALNSEITSCSNSGDVTFTASSTGNTGGILGDRTKGTVTNCHNVGTISGKYAHAIVGNGGTSETVTNCYYLASDTTDDFAVEKPAAEFQNGDVCMLPQGEQEETVWGQSKSDLYPVFFNGSNAFVPPVAVTGVTLNKTGLSMAVGESETLIAAGRIRRGL